MYLPCPHCRRIFQIDPGLIQTEVVRLRCPACGGRFVLQKKEYVRLPEACTDQPPREALGLSAPGGLSVREAGERDEPREPPDIDNGPADKRKKASGSDDPKGAWPFRPAASGVLWLLLPAFGLLLAMLGILMPVAGTDRLFPRQDGFVPSRATQHLAVPSPPGEEQNDRAPLATDPMSLSLLLGLGMTDPCQEASLASEPGQEESREARLCRLYPYWICFLSAPPSAEKSTCQADSVFSETSEALRSGGLCAEAHAFLAAYYIHKRVADRSLSCLEEARRGSDGRVWQKWVEVLYALQIDKDHARAEALLVNLLEDFPDFQLGRYVLARIQVEREQYERARNTLEALPDSVPLRAELAGIRQSLASIEASSYYSAERASGLLSLARSFASLGEAGTAEALLRRVLDGMPGRLAAPEEKAAFLELGRLQESRGDKEGAYSSYQSALRIDPLCQEARKNIQRLTAAGPKSS